MSESMWNYPLIIMSIVKNGFFEPKTEFRTFFNLEIRDSASRLANSGMAAAGNLMQSGWNAFNQMKESYS